MAQIEKSPVQIGSTEYRFPDRSFDTLTIRLESGGSFKTHIKLDNQIASATLADIFLDSGDAIEIKSEDVIGRSGKNISIINVTGDPKIFWYMH